MSEITQEQKDILAWIGMALLSLQTTESVIALSLKLVLPDDGYVTLETLERENGRKTLGQLLSVLRSRVDLADDFAATLDAFLEHRNSFIHRIDQIPGWSLDNPSGLQVARHFIVHLANLNRVVLNVFLGLLRSWQAQNDIEIPLPSDGGLFDFVDQIYRPIAANTFFGKEWSSPRKRAKNGRPQRKADLSGLK